MGSAQLAELTNCAATTAETPKKKKKNSLVKSGASAL